MIEVNPRVKDALRSGAYRKNYRINVLNDDGTTDFTLNNTELVSESVKIDERMCSGDTLKFGLCEGSSIEFQYFNHDNTNHPNIRGRRIQVFVDVQYKDADGEIAWEPIPMGYFDIQECSTQFSTGIMKVVGYNKLRSQYLDNKANDSIIEAAVEGEKGMDDGISIGSILGRLLGDFAVEPDYKSLELSENTNAQSEIWTVLLLKKEGDNYVPYSGSGGDLDESWLWVARAWQIYDYTPLSPVTARISLKERELYNMIRDHLEERLDEQGILNTYVRVSSEYVPTLDYLMLGTRLSEYHNVVKFGDDSNTYKYVKLRIGEHPDNEYTKTEYLYDVGFDRGHYMPLYFISAAHLDINPQSGGMRDQIYLEVVDESRSFSSPMMNEIIDNQLVRAEERIDTPMEKIVFTEQDAESLPDVTLRELQSAVFETSAEFGQLSRTTDLFEGVTLSRERLFPADDLYPSDTLYPQSVSESTFKSMYEKLWTDSVGEQTFRKLYITYKGLDDQQREKEFVLERTVNADGTTDYYCDDNWLFKNLIWTEQQVGDYADAMVLKMRGIKWFPFEMWSAGLPYIEVGDELEIISKDGTYTSYVLQRSLNGIQNLKDTYINGSLDIF